MTDPFDLWELRPQLEAQPDPEPKEPEPEPPKPEPLPNTPIDELIIHAESRLQLVFDAIIAATPDMIEALASSYVTGLLSYKTTLDLSPQRLKELSDYVTWLKVEALVGLREQLDKPWEDFDWPHRENDFEKGWLAEHRRGREPAMHFVSGAHGPARVFGDFRYFGRESKGKRGFGWYFSFCDRFERSGYTIRREHEQAEIVPAAVMTAMNDYAMTLDRVIALKDERFQQANRRVFIGVANSWDDLRVADLAAEVDRAAALREEPE